MTRPKFGLSSSSAHAGRHSKARPGKDRDSEGEIQVKRGMVSFAYDEEEEDEEMFALDDEEEFDEAVLDLPDDDGEEEEEENWGRSRKAYYSADVAPEDLNEEAVEARKLQKKQLKALSNEDFGLGDDASFMRANKNGQLTIDFDSEEEDDNNSNNNPMEDRFASVEEMKGLTSSKIEEMLSEEECQRILKQHGGEVRRFVMEFQRKLRDLKDRLEPTLQKLAATATGDKEGEGLAFLETKYQLLLGYCANLAFYLSLKLAGGIDIARHPVVERLVRYRLLLEKMRPMEARLQGQIDQLLRAATNNQSNATVKEELLRPNIQVDDAEFLQETDEEEEYDIDKGKIYKAPKLKAALMDKNESTRSEKQNHLLDDEDNYDEDAPEEDFIDPVYGKTERTAATRLQQEREQYEEENMVRFTLSKKEMKMAERLKNKPIDELQSLNAFFDSRRLGKDNSDDEGEAPTKFHTREFGMSKAPKANDDDDDDDDEVNSEISDIEDDMGEARDYYRAMERKAKDKKSKLSSNSRSVRYKPIADLAPNAPRPASYQMLKNKGLTPNRPKDVRNPRVHHRNKWERAQKRLKSFKAIKSEDTNRPYTGETSGIRTNIKKSVRFS